ncbi:Clathrin light chain [Penicillium verhagenii]|nr:Clathrin light chain [Penicillium verhagenii]
MAEQTDELSHSFPILSDAPIGAGETDNSDGLTWEQREAQTGLADEFSGQVPANEDAGDDDLLGGGSDTVQGIEQFKDSYPDMASYDQNQRVAPGGTITGTGSPFPPTGYQSPPQPEDEGDAVREWREKRDAEIARRAEVSAEKKETTVKKARENIDDFYVSYNNKAEKHRAQTKAEAEQFKENREDTSAGGTSWERIAKLVDVSGKGNTGGASGSGKERFRELLIDLRKDQEAPGASGI